MAPLVAAANLVAVVAPPKAAAPREVAAEGGRGRWKETDEMGTPELMKRPEGTGEHRSRPTQKRHGDPPKSSKSDSRSRHSTSKSASRESASRESASRSASRESISTMEPGRGQEDAVIKDMAGMDKDMQRRKSESRSGSSRSNGKRPTNSPTSRSASSSKTLRMDQEGDWLRQTDEDLEKDENQNKAPDGKVGPNRSNGV